MLSTGRIESVRRATLAFFNADPEEFDLIFVANATAAIKLVMDCMADYSRHQGHSSFGYAYHQDSHTSLVGPREVATHTTYLDSDAEVERWILTGGKTKGSQGVPGLFAFPAQSNMNGRRLPLGWLKQLREACHAYNTEVYSLLDAAAFAMTAPLDLSDASKAADFTALSLYKIFGFPDLGALIVRKISRHVFDKRRYFGGGTVDMVVNHTDSDKSWQAKKESLHELLEEGTPPFHSIIALGFALRCHKRMFGSMSNVSRYTANLAKTLYEDMTRLTYRNGQPVCHVYMDEASVYGDPQTQGPTIAFNLCDSNGRWIGKTEVEEAAIQAKIQLRTGGVCNPGGIATALDLSPEQMAENFVEGVRCGNEIDEMHGKPTGIVRVSLAAMSDLQDVKNFVHFLEQFARDRGERRSIPTRPSRPRKWSSWKTMLPRTSNREGCDMEKELHSRPTDILLKVATTDVCSVISVKSVTPVSLHA